MAFILPVALQVARWLATRYVMRAATARAGTAAASAIAARSTPLAARATVPRMIPSGITSPGVQNIMQLSRANPAITYGANPNLPLWVRSGQAMRRGADAIYGARPLSSSVRAFSPNMANRLAKPTASLSQRLAAKPTTAGKASTLLAAPTRAAFRATDATLIPAAVGGTELAGWSALVGANKDRFETTGVNFNPQDEDSEATLRYGQPYRGPAIDPNRRPTSQDNDVFTWDDSMATPDLPPVVSTIPPPGQTFTIPNRRPEPTVPLTPEETELSEFQQARADYERDLASLNSGYQNMLSQVRSMYQLSETEEEKQQLRFTLADLEEQFEAGKEAIANLYIEKTQTIQSLAAASRGRAGEAAAEASDIYSQAAIDLAALQEADSAAQIVANRGLGIGEIRPSPYGELLEATAPIAGQYAQRVGDISAEGLEYLAGLNEAMGAARQGELQSLYASGVATAGIEHARRVAERVAAERLAMASAVQSMMGQQLSMQQSMAGRRPRRSEFDTMAEARNNRIDQMAAVYFDTPQNFANQFAIEFGRAPTEEEWQFFETFAGYYKQQDTYNKAIQEAELANLQSSAAEQSLEQLYNLLDPGVPRTTQSLVDAGIISTE